MKALGIPFPSWDKIAAGGPLSARYDVILDALFGFSFKGEARPPFDGILAVRPGLVIYAVGWLVG